MKGSSMSQMKIMADALREASKIFHENSKAYRDCMEEMVGNGNTRRDHALSVMALELKNRQLAEMCDNALDSDEVDEIYVKANPTEHRVRELEKAISLILPMAEFSFVSDPNPSSDEWDKITNARAVLRGQLSVPEHSP